MSKKMKIEKTITDEQTAGIEAMRYAASFAGIRAAQKEIKESNLPWYPDLFEKSLTGGNLQEQYIQRYAKEWHIDLSDVKEMNRMKNKFSALSDVSADRFKFPPRFVTKLEDGTLEVNRESINEDFRRHYTVTLTDEQVQAIENIISGLETLGIPPGLCSSYFLTDDKGEIHPIVYKFVEKFKK